MLLLLSGTELIVATSANIINIFGSDVGVMGPERGLRRVIIGIVELRPAWKKDEIASHAQSCSVGLWQIAPLHMSHINRCNVYTYLGMGAAVFFQSGSLVV